MKSHEDSVIREALKILHSRAAQSGVSYSALHDTKAYLLLQHEGLQYEVFSVMFLDLRNKLIHFEKMFRGTVDVVDVPIREVVRSAIQHNAKSVVICHNHPSGEVWPSASDLDLTKKVREALGLLEIELKDHIIVSPIKVLSFFEEGLL